MQLNSRRRRDHGVGAHSPHDVILVTLDDPNHNTRRTNRITDACRHQASSIATRMLVNTDSARTSHNNATQMLAAGIDLRTAAGRLGHAAGGAMTLKVYAHRTRPADQRAAELQNDSRASGQYRWSLRLSRAS